MIAVGLGEKNVCADSQISALYHLPVRSYYIVRTELIKTPLYVLYTTVFGQNLISATSISSERASQEEQNGTNFSSVAPSIGEL